MAALDAFDASLSVARQNAIQDAREMQASVVQECLESEREPPPYRLTELIGKGSFGRVYKAQGTRPGQLVAVKIINIENGDATDCGADTFRDILNEIETLKLLSGSGVRNVNAVMDAILVGHKMWMVTEYCGGGSVSTLMKPTGHISEQWLIPILRESAEAIFWVHKKGIIHRDIKCANVLVMENGSVQLCDFGVAGIVQTKFDKRSTFTGSLHWMAPELFNTAVNYGTEVDIWAFGSMAFEAVSGLPPNASFRDVSRFGAHLRQNCPRLEGDQYSAGLKDLITRCMVEDPPSRPPIEELQYHPYIRDTEIDYPTKSLSRLVDAYRTWEAQGGNRASLFSPFGAQREPGFQSLSTLRDEWNFGTLRAAQQPTTTELLPTTLNALTTTVKMGPEPSKPQIRLKRAPPSNMRIPIVPLLKIFDPNTISNYQDNARVFYSPQQSPMSFDLPLRTNSEPVNVRESLIDLDAAFGDVPTRRATDRPLSSDPADNGCRRTLDWTFPIEPPASAGPHFPFESRNGIREEDFTIIQFQGDLVSEVSQDQPAQNARASMFSLIDLDESLPDNYQKTPRSSTADSDAPYDVPTAPFELERHASPPISYQSATREPYIYMDDSDFNAKAIRNLPDGQVGVSPPLAQRERLQDHLETDSKPSDGHSKSSRNINDARNATSAMTVWPPLPDPPPVDVMQGNVPKEDFKEDLLRLISSLKDHFGATTLMLETLPVRKAYVLKGGIAAEQHCLQTPI